MTQLREVAIEACEAIERGEPFAYLDNVVVPKLRAAIRNDELIERLNETCRCPDTMVCLSMGMCLEKNHE